MVRRHEANNKREVRRLQSEAIGETFGLAVKAQVRIYYRGQLVGAWDKDFNTFKQAIKEMLANVPISSADFPSSLVFQLSENLVTCSVHYFTQSAIVVKEVSDNNLPY